MEKLKEQLIVYLQENARYTTSQLASMIGCNEKEIETAIKELENDNVIVKYTAILNPEKIDGMGVDALIEVKVEPQKLKGFDAFAEQLCKFKEVKSLYLMSGVFDLAILVEGKNLSEVSKFVAEKLSAIDGVKSVATHFIMKKYKVEGQNTTVTESEKRQMSI